MKKSNANSASTTSTGSKNLEVYVRGVDEKLAYGHQGQCAEREAAPRARYREPTPYPQVDKPSKDPRERPEQEEIRGTAEGELTGRPPLWRQW